MEKRHELLAVSARGLDPVRDGANEDEPGWVIAGCAGRPVEAKRRFGRGGGVVWDSDPAEEVEESWTKAAPILNAIGAPFRPATKTGAAA